MTYEHASTQFALQNPSIAYSASTDQLSANEVDKAVAPLKSQTVLLLSGIAISPPTAGDCPTADPIKVIFGVYMPTPWDSRFPGQYKANQGHVIFQLEPRQELLEPTDPETPITDLVKFDTSTSSRGSLTFGARTASESGLSIDFSSGTATLKRKIGTTRNNENNDDGNTDAKPDAQLPSSVYQDVSTSFRRENSEHASFPAEGWESSMQINHLEIYWLPGSISVRGYDLPRRNGRVKPPTPLRPYEKPEPPHSQVSVEELAKRIEGFGPARK